jgi:hypothetical protein
VVPSTTVVCIGHPDRGEATKVDLILLPIRGYVPHGSLIHSRLVNGVGGVELVVLDVVYLRGIVAIMQSSYEMLHWDTGARRQLSCTHTRCTTTADPEIRLGTSAT